MLKSTFKKDCPARIRVGLSKDFTALEIKEANLCHSNHPTSKVFFDHIPENRRLSPKTEEDTKKLLAMGCNKKRVQTKLLEDKEKHITLKDISNIKAKLKSVDDESLPKAVELLETKYGASVKVLEEGKNFRGLFFVTKAMKKAMSKWPHIVFIDGTYKLLKCGLTLMLLIVQDSNGLSAVVGAALLASETRATFTWLLQTFKDAHAEACSRIHCFMSDKDLLERDVLKEIFPGTPVYICRFHTLRTFSRVITTAKMGISEEEKTTSLKLLQDLVYSSSESVYDKLYRKFLETVPDCVASYFNDNWHCIKEDWTTYSMVHGNLGNMTNNRLESLNAKVKQVVEKNSSLLQFFESFFKWMLSHNLEVSTKTAYAFLKEPVEKFAPGSDRQSYRDVLMPPSAKKVLEQIDQHKYVTNITCYDKRNNECIIRSHGIDLKVTPLSCECAMWTSEFLPCRHIFSVRKFIGVPLFAAELCQPRCTKQYMMESRQVPESQQSACSAKNRASPAISKVVTRKPATATEKRKTVTPIATEMLNLAVEASGSRFQSRKTVMEEICRSWKEGHEVTIIRSGGRASTSTRAAAMDRRDGSEHRVSTSEDVEMNNLSEILDGQCSFSDTGLSKPADISEGVLESPRSILMTNRDTPPKLTVESDAQLEDITMPPTIKTFGRPSRHLATTSGVARRKNIAKRFVDKSKEQKITEMLNWLIDNSSIELIIKQEYSVSIEDLKLEELKDSIVDDAVDLNLLSPYFEATALEALKKAVARKRKKDIYKCGRCSKKVVDNCVFCDQCLVWHHYHCVNLKIAPKTKAWFCPQCTRNK